MTDPDPSKNTDPRLAIAARFMSISDWCDSVRDAASKHVDQIRSYGRFDEAGERSRALSELAGDIVLDLGALGSKVKRLDDAVKRAFHHVLDETKADLDALKAAPELPSGGAEEPKP